MRHSNEFNEATRGILAHYLTNPVETHTEIGHLFSEGVVPKGVLSPVSDAISGFIRQGKVREISVASISQVVDPVLVAAVHSSSTAMSPKYCMEKILAEIAAREGRKAAKMAPKTLDETQLARRAGGALARLQRGVERLQTGYPELDRALGGGVTTPSIVVLGAKPKCGKSTIVASIAENVVAAGGYSYILDLENGLDRFLRRLMCRRAKVNPEVLTKDSFVPPESWRVTEDMVLKSDFGRRLFVDDQRRMPAANLERNIAELSERAQRDQVPFLIILDSLQKLPVENLSDRRSGIDRWMRWLEQIRDTYRATILLTSELKRPQQGQEYKPSEVALKESGDIEYTADLVLSLDRAVRDDEFAAEDGSDAPPATMRIVFNRDGRTGIVADYRLIYPFHDVEEIPRRRPQISRAGNVVPFGKGAY